jgi:hypothetical protein
VGRGIVGEVPLDLDDPTGAEAERALVREHLAEQRARDDEGRPAVEGAREDLAEPTRARPGPG